MQTEQIGTNLSGFDDCSDFLSATSARMGIHSSLLKALMSLEDRT